MSAVMPFPKAPAVRYTKAGLVQWLKEKALEPLVRRSLEAFARHVDNAYTRVTSARDAEAAAENLLSEWFVRRWLLNLATAQRVRSGFGRSSIAASARAPWIPQHVSGRLELLGLCVQAFNVWHAQHVNAIPVALARIMARSDEPKFIKTFDDNQIPASVRLGYSATWSLHLHYLALQRAHGGALSENAATHVIAAMELALARALGLALGLPGADDVRKETSVDVSDIEILDIEVEQASWSKYLRGARTSSTD